MEFPFDISVSESPFNSEEIKKLKPALEQAMANEVALQIAIRANAELHTTREAYISALTVVGNVIMLDTSNFGVHVAEEGNESFDMKEKLLRSPKAKIAKNGQRYLVVPLPKYRDGKYNWRNRDTGRLQKGTNSGPVEFRVVSDSSPTDSWIYPKVEGNHFFDAVIEEFDAESFALDFIAQNSI